MLAVVLSMAAASRLEAINRSLLLDGRPYLVRGVAYSPTPIGIDPSATQTLDFFSDEYRAIYERDLPRMAAIGVNALRIYDIDTSCEVEPCTNTHLRFFEACAQHNISVTGSFALSPSRHYFRTEGVERTIASALRSQLRRLTVDGAYQMPSSAVMWMIGNELNLPSAGFLCDGLVERSNASTACQYSGGELATFFRHIDSLCAIVHQFHLLCSSPLAEYPLPASYDLAAHRSAEG